MSPSKLVRERQWRLARLLTAHKRGITAAQLMTKLGASRATLYRDLEELEKAGFPLIREVRNGETRLSLPVGDVPSAVPTALQVHALRLARMALVHLEGSWVTREMDKFLRGASPAGERAPKKVISLRPPRPNGDSEGMAVLEEAIRRERGVRFTYRASSRGGASSERQVDPRKIRALSDGATYLIAWDLKAKDWRTFKLVRMADVTIERRTWEKHPPLAEAELGHGKALRAWSGAPVKVKIALAKEVAWMAGEYALPHQSVETRADGSAVVSAEVTGLVEVMRWVLGWGRCAQVLEPVELATAVRDELRRAASQYR